MADKKITGLPELTEVADDDYLEIVDTSTNTSKKISRETLAGWHFLTTPLTSSTWSISSPKSTTVSTKIDLSDVFGVPDGIKAVFVRLVVRDSGTYPQNDKYVSFGPTSDFAYALSAYAYGNDIFSGENGIIPCSEGDIYYRVVASGTDTMDVQLEIWGYWL